MNFILAAEELAEMQAYLRRKKWIAPDEDLISAKKPGEGNMNYTLRVRTNFRTFILKQSRPYVEKYPQVAAPKERALIEAKFYELIQTEEKLYNFTPELVDVDEVNFLIQLEDLGDYEDFSFLYQSDKLILEEELLQLGDFLSHLHSEFNSNKIKPTIENRAMRNLNAEHIFNYPFLVENGFDLDTINPGLQEVAMTYKTDEGFKRKLKELSAYYLDNGPTLLHGDYYPGSWLKTLEGVKIIDPEFGFFGRSEFDLSVWIAHFLMGEQEGDVRSRILEVYDPKEEIDLQVLDQLTGVEVMRRLIGLAQLPLSIGLEKKSQLLKEAYRLIMS